MKNQKLLSIIIQCFTFLFLAIITFFYFYYYVEPKVVYFKNQPLFVLDNLFLKKFIVLPGGIAEYLTLFISQFFISDFWGSLFIVSLIFILPIVSGQILKQYTKEPFRFVLKYLPALFLIYLHSHYNYDVSNDIILVFALLFAFAYQKISENRLVYKIPYILLTDIILFFFFSGTALLIYSLMVILIECHKLNRKYFWLMPFLQIISCVAAFMIALKHYPQLNFNNLLPGILYSENYFKPTIILYLLFFSLPICIILIIILRNLYTLHSFFNRIFEGKLQIVIFSLFFAILTALFYIDMRFSYNRKAKNLIKIHLLAQNYDWQGVIKIAEELPVSDRKVMFQVNRALYHLDALLEKSFSYSQFYGEHGLMLNMYYSSEVAMLCSDLFYDMGHIKESLHWAYEAQTKSAFAPDVLKRIAIGNIITGEYKSAQKFLKILSKSIIYRKWALYYMEYLNNENLIRQDKEIIDKRDLSPKIDFYSNIKNPRYDLYRLFKENSGNKMAFEYFIMYSLLTHNLIEIVENLSFIENLDYKKLPVYIEESLVLFMTLNESYQPELGRYHISEMTKRRFSDYMKILMKYHNDRKAARLELYDKYGNTYWYYIHYISPITTKRKIFQ
jgi:hypothetical protein